MTTRTFYRKCVVYLMVAFSASACAAVPELTIQVQDYATMPITDGGPATA